MIITEADVTDALGRKCGLCQAPQGQHCINICDGEPLPGRSVHFYRIEPK